jgi:DNA-binding MarR family transcriptional regulator
MGSPPRPAASGNGSQPAVETAHALMQAMMRLRARLRSESLADELPLSWSQVGTLIRIVDTGRTTTSELAQVEHVRRQSMAETVAALKNAGLVVTEPDPTDGRKALISATAEGHELRVSIPAARGAWLGAAIDAELAPAERELLAAAAVLMDRLADVHPPTE